jgi:hypothetical protein
MQDEFDFDFDNIEKYVKNPEKSDETIKRIEKLWSLIKPDELSETERTFLASVEMRIKYNRALSDKQKEWLAKILIRFRV